ncbi:hypothetical protein M407DRAFT_31713 [Tulasnella calospora MUT 4182]|uniref:BTB domain-containing protein n=1 Tax=Tulasnella calospora MUT 4182 TaxID=1051891 RepID=A0A0C3LAV6_9AGAM|nr:hypothetical protein M407DRAFT_31713 [Tulasnella calospora MUT 4182]
MSDAPNAEQSISITIDGTAYRKHNKHWYPDGNIIFTVENLAFRVFKSFLIRRSEVMALVLTVPQPNEPSEDNRTSHNQQSMIDGIPVVSLSDPARDFDLLLDMILPQTCASAPISSDTPWGKLLGLAQIAQKYGVDDVLAQTVVILDGILPTTDNQGAYTGPTDPICVIEWARRCSLPQYLPMAFYYLTTIQWGLHNIDLRTIQRLPPSDQVRIQQGRAKLQSEVIKAAVTRWENTCVGSWRPEKGCPSRDRSCWMGYEGKAWDADANEERWTNLLLHPLEELSKRVDDREIIPLSGVCSSCRQEFIEANRRMRRDLRAKVMYSNSDSDMEDCPRVIRVINWKDPRTPVIIGGTHYYKDLYHWYDDGNIILIVQDNAFRIFQSILIKRSQVLKDVLGLPPATATNEANGSVSDRQPILFEGAPVVRLNDKARHFQLLLNVLLPKDFDKLPISEDLRREDLMGLTQIAKKYEFDDVTARAVSVLQKVLPTKEQPDKPISTRNSSFNIRLWVQVINWARLCGLPQFLPLPFYHLATNEWKDANPESLSKAVSSGSVEDSYRPRNVAGFNLRGWGFPAWEGVPRQRMWDDTRRTNVERRN